MSGGEREARRVSISTRRGDDGSTGQLGGGRVPKDSAGPMACGDVDEAQAAIGVARAECPRAHPLNDLLASIERDLWIVMAELATPIERRSQLVDGTTRVSDAMVAALEASIDATQALYEAPTEFVLPGQNRLSALLDLARTVVRRAERRCVGWVGDDSKVLPYLNRLSDLMWVLARWQDGESLPADQRSARRRRA